MPELSVLMPVYNERPTVAGAIAAVLEADLPVADLELLVVDDGSDDGSERVLGEGPWPENVRVLRHPRNRGKGAAVRTALAEASGEYAVVMDADLEYDAADLAAVLEPLTSGRAEAVLGTRAFQAHAAYNFWYVVGNKGVGLSCNVLYDCWLSDVMTGQKAMRTELFRALPLREEGFAIEAEIVAQLLLAGIRIYEVPTTYRARRREEGKKLTSFDGVRVVGTLLRCRVAGRRTGRR